MPSRRTILLASLAVVVAAGLAATKRYVIDRPHAEPRWQYEIVQRRLLRVDNVTVGSDGMLYVTLERGDGKGEIVQLRDGALRTVVTDLNRPDGLVAYKDSLYVSEEVKGGRILKVGLADFRKQVITRLDKPEGIKVGADGMLVIAQDLADGRVIKLSDEGDMTVIADHLKRPEGLSLGAKGEIYVAETATGRILRISDAGTELLVDGLVAPDQVATGPEGAIWITEDREGARLLRYKSGKLETILTNLNKPQGIAVTDAGSVYVAEQGRNRLLLVRRAR